MIHTADDVLSLQLLGPVRAWRGAAELDLGSAHRRAVLAVLASSPGGVVSREELVDALWGDSPPASANGSIYTYISSLRQALAEDGTRTGREILESVGSGYSLRVAAERVDAHRFATLRLDAQSALHNGDSRTALTTFDKALALWSGDAFAGLSGPFAEAQRTRLGELRVATAEQRAEAGLAAGRHLEVIAHVGPIARELPLRERPRELLIRALDECGRRTEALEVFDDFRETLIQVSGTEPSPALHKLRERVLGGETGAAVAQLGGRAGATRRPVRTPAFTGREDILTGLRAAVSATANGLGAALLLHGPAGIGKSAVLAELLAGDAVGDLRVGYATADDLGAAYPLRLISACLSTSDRRVALAGPADETTMREAVSVVRELCATGPLVVVADDLQWADEDSLRVWRRLVGLTEELPLVLLGACRPRPGPAELERLRVDLALRGNLVVCLGPLPDAAAHTLVERLVGAPPGRELRRLVATAAGNPFYVKEIVEKLVDEGRIVVDGADAFAAEPPELPPALVTRIVDHLAFLSDETREALRWAALLGDAFTVHDLAAVIGLPLGQLGGVVEESLHSGLVVESGESLSFGHPVVRQALRQRTPASMRAVLHRHLAQRLADRGAAAGGVAEQLAAARVPVDEWTESWLAEHAAAVASDDPHLVVELLRYVVAQPSFPAQPRDALTVTLARLLFWLGREPSAEARLLLARSPDAEHAAELRWILAYLHYRHGRLAEAADEVRRTLTTGDTSDGWRELHLRLRDAIDAGKPAESLRDVTRLLDVGPLARDVSASPALARRTAPYRALPGEIHLAGAVRGYWAGRWQETTEEVGIILRGHPETPSHLVRTPTSVVLGHGLAALIAGHRGEHDRARDLLLAATEPSFPHGDDAVLDPEAAAFLLAGTALLAEHEGCPEQALDALAPILDPADYPDRVRGRWLSRLTRLAMRAGDRERAGWIAETAEDGAGTDEAQAVAAHCRGILTGNPDPIVAAAEHYVRTDDVLQAAWAREDAAVPLAERGRLEEARASLRCALKVYTRVGASGDVRRAETRMRPHGIRRAGAVPVSLPREGRTGGPARLSG